MNILRKIFSVNNMLKPGEIRGEIIRTRSAYNDLVRIAIPSIVEMVFVSLISSVDIAMIGRLGFESVAAVGLATQPRLLMLSVFLAMNVGVTAIVARRKGENRPEEANRTIRNAIILVLGLTAIVTSVAIVFSRPLMLFSGAQDDTVDMSTAYFRIISYFLPVNTLTMCINAAQRGVGNTRTCMIANLSANVVNVFMNYLLIYGKLGMPRLGVAGAAWASGIGFCVGLMISVAALFGNRFNNDYLHISFRDDWRLHKATVKSIIKLGSNSVLEQIAQRFGVYIFAIIIANLGTAAFAAHQVGMQFLNFTFNFGNGLAVASITLVGQMLGKKRPDLAIIYGKCSQRIAFLMSIVIVGSIILLRVPLVSIFLNRRDPANMTSFNMAVNLVFVVACFQLLQTSVLVYAGCLRGAGDNLFVAVTMVICVAIVRPVLSAIAVYVFGLGLIGAWSASLIDIFLRLTFVSRRFSGSKWQDKKV